ncbi:hypothetical protein [Phytoactinopolyspora mesophila]|uniref:Uncharacterized protein n=1 Tax=Phytoactinopolyspora mesophila TaxID=2650750 RepID=A0A7K3M2N8_9ACTN|nr:hypothetical protein [Phytoactinopolyspora mesophila]NDL57182.1 hypothetical protein [Phytoactinopolyspora mesophila]
MKVTVPAWIHGHYVGLRQVLDFVGSNTWAWRLEDFHGMSRPGSGLNVLDLEERLARGASVDYNWQQLLRFADGVHQMIDGRLVARTSHGNAEDILVIEALDSSLWTVEARKDLEPAVAAVERIAGLSVRTAPQSERRSPGP